MKRPMMFFATGDCGCSGNAGSSYSQSGNDPASCYQSGALIADNRYYGLPGVPSLQVLGVAPGSNQQAYLKAANGINGFLTYSGGVVSVDPDPTLTLPLINPPTSGSYPVPGTFSALVVGVGSVAGFDWRHLVAPTTGSYFIKFASGSISLTDASTIPGLNEIASSGVTTLKGEILTSIQPTPGNFAIRKLRSIPGRVIVGFQDGSTGETGYTPLATTDFLAHPKGQFTALQSNTYQATDVNNNPIANGLPVLVTSGVGAVTDAVSAYYSPGGKQFYLAPASTNYFVGVSVNSGPQTVPSTYAPLPGGHGAGAAKTFNFPTVQITFFAGMGSTAVNNTQSFSIYKDGALLMEFDNDTNRNVALIYVDENVTLGSHTYDIRWKKTSGTDQVNIRNSSLLVRTLT